MSEFRGINKAIGLNAKIGSFALYQVFSTLLWGLSSYYFKQAMGGSWMGAVGLFALGNGTTLLLLGDKPWMFLSRLVRVPHLFTIRMTYRPLLSKNYDNKRKPN